MPVGRPLARLGGIKAEKLEEMGNELVYPPSRKAWKGRKWDPNQGRLYLAANRGSVFAKGSQEGLAPEAKPGLETHLGKIAKARPLRKRKIDGTGKRAPLAMACDDSRRSLVIPDPILCRDHGNI